MIGAIVGDVVGSVFEADNHKDKGFALFCEHSRATDDSILTVALAEAILSGERYDRTMRRYYEAYPYAGYGGGFWRWALNENAGPYNSFGNGSAMRVSPVGWAYDSLEQVLLEAQRSAAYTHNHPEGIKGAQAVAAAIYWARTGMPRAQLKLELEQRFGYDLSQTIDQIRPAYEFDVSCQGSVPQALMAALESTDFEDAIRNAVSIGGDSDTIACMAGAVAEAMYAGVPKAMGQSALRRLDRPMQAVVQRFMQRFVRYQI